MFKKVIILIFAMAITLGSLYLYMSFRGLINSSEIQKIHPLSSNTDINNNSNSIFQDKLNKTQRLDKDIINILLIGTDTSQIRRTNGQGGYNTDSLILVSINRKTNKVLLTSVPRDLWIKGNKINALCILFGQDVLISAFEEITGQKIDGYIKTDFDGFIWIVNSFGGIDTEIKNSFTDNSFPTIDDSDITSHTFEQGIENMNGERALTYARSRKGNNGEGSDLKRAQRQHLILQGMLNGISKPQSIFYNMDIKYFYETVTQHMETDLSIGDVSFLWDFYKDREMYEIESFVVDDKYIYHPGVYPQSEYHAWVFISKDENFENLHTDITLKLNKEYKEENIEEDLGNTNINNINSGEDNIELKTQ